MRGLRIAQVSPLFESVPPQLYGGTERIVAYLTEELVGRGHEVTLFASGDSQTNARLVAPCARALRLAGCIDPLAHHYVMLEELYRRASDFDVIHFHIDYLHFMASRRAGVTHLTTLHGRLDLEDLVSIYREFPEMPVVSISDAQRAPLPWIAWQGTVLHGLPLELHRPGGGGDYLAFVGRIAPEKGIDRAIEIARRVGMPLKVAAKIDVSDREYFTTKIEPLFAQSHVEYVGELGEAAKGELLGGARALVFPIDWPEPFGLVMIEAMACGTPVVAYRRGSTPEVIDEGVTGFLVDDLEAAVRATERAGELSRATIRETFERRFSSARMADDYLALYHRLVRGAADARAQARLPGLRDPGHRLARR